MNNDLENLYGDNNNTMNVNTNNNSTTEEIFNNNISTESQDLSSLYGNSNVMQTPSNNVDTTSSDIMVNQEGLNKLYNQSTVDLEAEPVNEGTGPVVVKPKEEQKKVIRNEYVTEEDLLVAYVGSNFEKIASTPFNIAAFFFGNLYLFFRKKILYGLVLFIIQTVLSRFVNTFLVSIGIAIIIGVSFNGIYIKDAKNYIENLKKKNPTKSNAELRDICKKSGGVSFLYLIGGFFLSIFVGIVVSMVMVTLGFTQTNTSININIDDLINKNSTVYLGSVDKDKNININDKYTIEIPTEFTKDNDNTSEISYKQDNCNFALYKAAKETNAKNLATQMSIYYLSVEDVKTTNINSIDWYYVENQDGTETQYHYITSKNSEVYIFEYNTDTKDKACMNAKDKVLNSIKNK